MKNLEDIIVYFGGAIRGDRIMGNIMGGLVKYIQSFGIRVLTEHVGAQDPIDTFAKKLGKRKEELEAIDIERQDIEWLDIATHVIAEISGASTGTGREIEYARMKGRFGKTEANILCLYKKEREFYASPMIRGMVGDKYQNVRIRSYTDFEEACSIIKDFLFNK